MAAVVVAVEATGAGVGAAAASGGCRSRYMVRSLYWRLRAGLRRLHLARAGRWCSRGRFSSFHYDALSYALNFDDGSASADFVR